MHMRFWRTGARISFLLAHGFSGVAAEATLATPPSEDFSGGIPSTWTIVHSGTCTGATATWDVSTCPAPEYNLYAGPLSAVSSYGYDTWTNGALGTSGQADVALSPGNVFFVVVTISGGFEGSHGRTSSGVERPASGVGHCSVTAKEASATCP